MDHGRGLFPNLGWRKLAATLLVGAEGQYQDHQDHQPAQDSRLLFHIISIVAVSYLVWNEVCISVVTR